ncbi:hypothetical protein GCM10023194_58120 [Planotetraspora phitsanulokensis]|uniref:Uncharacterized protein n=1 Tax=Planotetraspora phitsanulokensis TaxID=575192 RepID=A0A8J3UK74_9ACTN|nr:hypothetical protein [Planotetraspora phitsanulokensis]GII40275.1 hypothetical protein Pph01_52780 [Planotetraspora phitsanulokensis]
MIMTLKRSALLVAAVAVLASAALVVWFTTEDDRRLDDHLRQALEGYEQAFAADGAQAAPTPLRRDGRGRVIGAPAVERVTLLEDGITLSAEFVGRKSTGGCGADYTARAVESEHAALILVEEHLQAGEACTDVGYRRRVTVRLNRPLGGRAVLEAMTGTPVPVGRDGRSGD